MTTAEIVQVDAVMRSSKILNGGRNVNRALFVGHWHCGVFIFLFAVGRFPPSSAAHLRSLPENPVHRFSPYYCTYIDVLGSRVTTSRFSMLRCTRMKASVWRSDKLAFLIISSLGPPRFGCRDDWRGNGGMRGSLRLRANTSYEPDVHRMESQKGEVVLAG